MALNNPFPLPHNVGDTLYLRQALGGIKLDADGFWKSHPGHYGQMVRVTKRRLAATLDTAADEWAVGSYLALAENANQIPPGLELWEYAVYTEYPGQMVEAMIPSRGAPDHVYGEVVIPHGLCKFQNGTFIPIRAGETGYIVQSFRYPVGHVDVQQGTHVTVTHTKSHTTCLGQQSTLSGYPAVFLEKKEVASRWYALRWVREEHLSTTPLPPLSSQGPQ